MRLLAFSTPPSLTSAEKQELRVIGVVLASLTDIEVHTNDLNIEAGLVEGGSSAKALVDDLDGYSAIVTYRKPPLRMQQAGDAHIPDLNSLKLFSEVAVKSMYRRGLEP